jgi:hypothetical protein
MWNGTLMSKTQLSMRTATCWIGIRNFCLDFQKYTATIKLESLNRVSKRSWRLSDLGQVIAIQLLEKLAHSLMTVVFFIPKIFVVANLSFFIQR